MARIRQIGSEPVASATPAAFRELLVSQKAAWGEMVKTAKVPIKD